MSAGKSAKLIRGTGERVPLRVAFLIKRLLSNYIRALARELMAVQL